MLSSELSITAPPREVQCQRTRYYLPTSVPEGCTVRCPWCADHETYEHLRGTDFPSTIVAQAIAMCRAEFGVTDDDGIATAFWLGSGPETVYEPHLNRVNIYLGRRSDPW